MKVKAIKERPILFTGEMVRAILDGRKTQTRRALKPQPVRHGRFWNWNKDFSWDDNSVLNRGVALEPLCPYGVRGDRLWVKETFGIHRGCPKCVGPVGRGWLHYPADDSGCPATLITKLKPAIFMCREYSRLTLEIVRVRVERIQDISEADAMAEGITHSRLGYSGPYRFVWDSINGKTHPWKSNPWVWVIEFKKSW